MGEEKRELPASDGLDDRSAPASDGLDPRSQADLEAALGLTEHTVYKRYLDELSQYPLASPTSILMDERPEKCVRMFRLDQLTCKKGEDILQKLSTVYHAAMSMGCSVFVMVDVPAPNSSAEIYLGIRSPDGGLEPLSASFGTLKNGLLSNFPGSHVTTEDVTSVAAKLDSVFGEQTHSIASVSCVASIRDKSKTEQKGFVQGLEKMIDVMRGKPYTAVLIAEPVSPAQQAEIRKGYETIYSTISPFRKSTWSYNENDSSAVMESLSHGISKTVTESASHTQSHTVSHTKGSSDTFGVGVNGGMSQSNGSTKPTDASRVGAVLSGTDIGESVGNAVGKTVGKVVGGLAGLATNLIVPGSGAAVGAVMATVMGKVIGKKVGNVVGTATKAAGAAMQGKSITESLTKALGLSASYSRSQFRSTTESEGTSDTNQHGTSEGTMDTSASGTTMTESTGRTLQIENVNKPIEELLSRIEEQLKRVREGEDYGAYSCGAYFLGKRENTLLAANTYRALMIGEGSSVESGAVNIWDEPNMVAPMKEYLRRFAQPVFVLPLTEDMQEGLVYSPGTIVSGLELPMHLGLPTRSVVGLPVIDHAEFGRNVATEDPALRLGSLYHMGQVEPGAFVGLNIPSLASHTFITGSTGAGKTNAVCHILNELSHAGGPVSFLVVEPAKGEYKHMFGGRPDVSVYGTNPALTPLLRLNPFSFPEGIHVLEHMDRLVELFNVCWPMYAAMPAVLKSAVERAYSDCGWDLFRSVNRYGEAIYPSFADVARNVREIIDTSEYDTENKGAYKGSLLTRLQSLTSGLNGMIFSCDDIPDRELFDGNVIVDLSRVGSSETKSLLMGMLVLKLQEYRMTTAAFNTGLRHLTVLEEAHNLLRRTTPEQSAESANLMGKSVEMLSNAIAEMRAYGEGFIIADQAPGLLDMAVIRNTNTKIILRLPDQEDRELVGRASGLNDDQIGELAKLPCGVAAVYQNEWVQPVLCKVDRHANQKGGYVYVPTDGPALDMGSALVAESLLDCIMNTELMRVPGKAGIRRLKDRVLRSGLDTAVKRDLLEYLAAGEENDLPALRRLIYDFLSAGEAVRAARSCREIDEWTETVAEALRPSILGFTRRQIDLTLELILYEQAERDQAYCDLFSRFIELRREEGTVS